MEKVIKDLQNFEKLLLVTQKYNSSLFEEFKRLVQMIKSVFSEINLSFERNVNDKVMIFLHYLPLIQNHLNKLQFGFSKITSPLEVSYLFIDLKSVINFIIWALVNNLRESSKYREIVSANLLSKLLITPEIYTVLPMKFHPLSPSFFDEFGPVFNYYQTSAGLYASPIIYLVDLEKKKTTEWASLSFYFHSFVLEILENLDLNGFVSATRHDNARNFTQMLMTIHWPLVNLLDLIIHLYQKIGDEWLIEIETHGLMSSKNKEGVKILCTRISRLINRLSTYLDDNPSMQNEMNTTSKKYFKRLIVTISIINRLLEEIELKLRDLESISDIVNNDLDDLILDYRSKLMEFDLFIGSENNLSTSMISDFYVDILMDLYALYGLKSLQESNLDAFKGPQRSLGQLVSKIVPFKYPKLEFISLIVRIFVKAELISLNDLRAIVVEMDASNLMSSAPSRDFIAIKILRNILSYYLEIDPTESIVLDLCKLKENREITESQTHIIDELNIYIDHLIAIIQDYTVDREITRDNKINVWDLKSWIIPNFEKIAKFQEKRLIRYLPFNLESDCVR